jgi:plasmid stability protein
MKKYADITVDAYGRSLEKTADEILKKVLEWRKKQVKKALAIGKKKKK